MLSQQPRCILQLDVVAKSLRKQIQDSYLIMSLDLTFMTHNFIN